MRAVYWLLAGCAATPAQNVCRSGVDAARRREFNAAAELLERCVKDPAVSIEAYLALAGVYQAAGKSEELFRTVTAGIRRFPEEKRFYVSAGTLAGRNKQYAEAIRLLTPAAARWPEDERIRRLLASAHFGRGTELLDAGRNTEAVESLKQAVALTPDDAEAQMNLGRALHNLHRYGEARHAFERVIDIQPTFPLVWFHHAMSLYAAGDANGAIADLDREMAANSGYAPAHLLRGVARLSQGSVSEALADLVVASERMPDDAAAQFGYGRALIQTGRFADAEPVLRRAMQLDPKDPGPVNALVTVLLRLERQEEAKALSRQALDLARRRRTAGEGEIRYSAPDQAAR